MKGLSVFRSIATLTILLLVLAACQAGSSPSAAESEPPESEAAGSEAPASEAPPSEAAVEPVPFVVGFTSIGLSSVPFLAAIDELRDLGFEIETPELAESELVTEGVAQNEFQFGSGANNSSMAAIEQGAEIQWIVDRTLNEWQVYAREPIQTCEEVVNSRVAIHSPGSVSGAMLLDWINNNCPEDVAAAYEPLIIEGSQNRLAALLADQIDTSPVEFGDAIILDNEGGFGSVVSFSADLPELHPTSVYGNSQWMQDNPEVTTLLVTKLIEQYRRINSEDGYLMQLFEEYLPEEAAGESAQAIVDAYIEQGIFPDDGGLDDAAVEYTIGFFGPEGTGDVSVELPPEDVADLSYLEAALDELGN
jgi:ABC-type nitrate/sulfonate/bicarbonate transport system substrate-binding protein